MRVGKDIIRRSNIMNISVLDPNSHLLLFKFRSLKPLKSLLYLVCKIKEITIGDACFSYKDKLVELRDAYGEYTTPESLGMKDGDHVTLETKYNQEIRIKILTPNRRKVSYRIRKSLKMDKVLQNYCKRNGFDPERTRFICKNGEISISEPDTHPSDKATPFTLGLEDGDIICAYELQLGAKFKFTTAPCREYVPRKHF